MSLFTLGQGQEFPDYQIFSPSSPFTTISPVHTVISMNQTTSLSYLTGKGPHTPTGLSLYKTDQDSPCTTTQSPGFRSRTQSRRHVCDTDVPPPPSSPRPSLARHGCPWSSGVGRDEMCVLGRGNRTPRRHVPLRREGGLSPGYKTRRVTLCTDL